jgi:hypothetical protein
MSSRKKKLKWNIKINEQIEDIQCSIDEIYFASETEFFNVFKSAKHEFK